MSEPEELVRAIAAAGVRDPRVLDVLREVPRSGFVPPDLAGRAYEDKPQPIARSQVTTQPSLVARMVEALELTGSERSACSGRRARRNQRCCGVGCAGTSGEDVEGR